VIEKLADRATGKAKNVVIPYRDSKLTRLLQNALGGSSKTIMICAISPASSNYEETLSTLRYADRAKRIKNSATINENPQDKLIRQLREENQQLREMIGAQGTPTAAGDNGESQEALLEKQQEIAALEQALQEMQRSFQDKISEAQANAQSAAQQKKEKSAETTMPHITNLNEDDLLTNKLRFPFKDGQTKIGRPGAANEEPEVALSGPGIQGQHATVQNSAGICTLVAAADAAAATFVNGTSLEGKDTGVQLAHGDRVAFGQCFFVFVDPAVGKATELLESGKVSYAMARKEQGTGDGPTEEELKASREMAEELERKVRAAEEAKQLAKQEAEELLRKREKEFQEQMARRQAEWEKELKEKAEAAATDEQKAAEQAQKHAAELARLQKEFEDKQRLAEAVAQNRIKELEAAAKRAAAEEEEHRHHELAMQRLEEELMNVMPLVKEANLIAQELKRPERLETKMRCELTGGKRGTIRVVAEVQKGDVKLFEWSAETLENRVFLLRELLQRCEEEGFEIGDELTEDDDPLWDPIEIERMIGTSQVLLEGLLLQVENSFDSRILNEEGHQAGSLRVEVIPLGSDGTPGVPDAEVVDDPQDLLGSKLACLLKVVKAADIPEALANDVRVEYNYFVDEKPHRVPAALGHNRNPVFNYTKTFVQDPVTSRFLDYLQSSKLVFRVYGRDTAAESVRDASEAAKSMKETATATNAAVAEAAVAVAAALPIPNLDGGEPSTMTVAGTEGGLFSPSASPLSPSGLPGAIPEQGAKTSAEEKAADDSTATTSKAEGSSSAKDGEKPASVSLSAIRKQAEDALKDPPEKDAEAHGKLKRLPSKGGSKSCVIL